MRQQNNAETYPLPYTVRAGGVSFVMILVPGMFISLALLSLIGRGPAAVLPVVVIICLVWGSIGALLLGIKAQKIILLPDRICYRTLFSQREIRYAGITRIALERVEGSGYRSSKVIRYMLRIEDRSSKPLLINTKPFSKKNMSVVVEILAKHASSADLDTSLLRLSEDTF